LTGRTGSVVTPPPLAGERTGNMSRRSGAASCCHSQVSAAGRAACQALAVSPALRLTKGTCSMRLSAAANTVAGRKSALSLAPAATQKAGSGLVPGASPSARYSGLLAASSALSLPSAWPAGPSAARK